MTKHLVTKSLFLEFPMFKYIWPVFLHGEPIGFSTSNATHAICMIAPRIHGGDGNTHCAGTPVGTILLSYPFFDQGESRCHGTKKAGKFHAGSSIPLDTRNLHCRKPDYADYFFYPCRAEFSYVLCAWNLFQFFTTKGHAIRRYGIMILENFIETAAIRSLCDWEPKFCGHFMQEPIRVLILSPCVMKQEHNLLSRKIAQRPARAPRGSDAAREPDNDLTLSQVSSPYASAFCLPSTSVWT
jgi:hypothetical protein